MKLKKTILFNKISISKSLSAEQIEKALAIGRYSDDKGIGFTSIETEENELTLRILIKTPSAINSYDNENGTFEEQVIYIYSEVEVYWDVRAGLIYTTFPNKYFSKVKNLISDSLPKQIILEDIEFQGVKFISKLKEEGTYNVFITDLLIHNFVYKNEARGRFYAHTDDYKLGEELLNEYSSDIAKITLLLEPVKKQECEKFKMCISSRNSLHIETEENAFFMILSYLKHQIQ